MLMTIWLPNQIVNTNQVALKKIHNYNSKYKPSNHKANNAVIVNQKASPY